MARSSLRREPFARLTWEQARAWRFRRHHLDEPAPKPKLLEVVDRVCGLHAQLMSSAELSACARVSGLRIADVQDALWKKRTLVKTWAMRGTLHLIVSPWTSKGRLHSRCERRSPRCERRSVPTR